MELLEEMPPAARLLNLWSSGITVNSSDDFLTFCLDGIPSVSRKHGDGAKTLGRYTVCAWKAQRETSQMQGGLAFMGQVHGKGSSVCTLPWAQLGCEEGRPRVQAEDQGVKESAPSSSDLQEWEAGIQPQLSFLSPRGQRAWSRQHTPSSPAGRG